MKSAQVVTVLESLLCPPQANHTSSSLPPNLSSEHSSIAIITALICHALPCPEGPQGQGKCSHVVAFGTEFAIEERRKEGEEEREEGKGRK